MSVTGSIAGNFHQGARSEYLAQYFFTGFGTSAITPRPEDYGVDLSCTLGTQVDKRLLITHYYLVQVKSTLEEVTFQSRESVRWLMSQNYPLFICVVDKNKEEIQLFSTIKIFQIFDYSQLESITMRLHEGTEAENKQSNNVVLNLYPPILSASVREIADTERLSQLKSTIEYWIGLSNVNIDWRNIGITIGLSHAKYPTNTPPEDHASLSGNFKGHLSISNSAKYFDTLLIFLANEINLAASKRNKGNFESMCDLVNKVFGTHEISATYGLFYLQLAINAGAKHVGSDRHIEIRRDGRRVGVVDFRIESGTT